MYSSTASRKENILLLFFAFLVFSCLSFLIVIHYVLPSKIESQNEEFPTLLEQISKEEKTILEWFFKELLLEQRFAYTLFGDKPISFVMVADVKNCSKKSFSRLQKLASLPKYYLMKDGWDIYAKYRYLIPEGNFVLKQVSDPKDNYLHLILINKKSFLNIIEDNLKLFQKLLHNKITSDSLLQDFITKPYPLRDTLMGQTVLRGILLGYGVDNSKLYQRKDDIEKALLSELYNEGLSIEALDPSEEFSSLEEELQNLSKRLVPFSPKKSKDQLPLPFFLADLSSEESQGLQKKYLHQREMILQLLEDENFLDIVFKQLGSK